MVLILEGRPEGPGGGECLCVFWMKLLSSNPDGPWCHWKKTLKRATRKNVFMAPCVMFPYTGLEVGRKRNWQTSLLPTALPICHFGLQGKEGLEEGKGLSRRRGNAKVSWELILSSPSHLCVLAQGAYHMRVQWSVYRCDSPTGLLEDCVPALLVSLTSEPKAISIRY